MDQYRYSRTEKVSSSVARRARKRLKRLGSAAVGGVDASDGITGGEARAIRNALRAKRNSANRQVVDAPKAGGQKPYRRIKKAKSYGGKTP